MRIETDCSSNDGEGFVYQTVVEIAQNFAVIGIAAVVNRHKEHIYWKLRLCCGRWLKCNELSCWWMRQSHEVIRITSVAAGAERARRSVRWWIWIDWSSVVSVAWMSVAASVFRRVEVAANPKVARRTNWFWCDNWSRLCWLGFDFDLRNSGRSA